MSSIFRNFYDSMNEDFNNDSYSDEYVEYKVVRDKKGHKKFVLDEASRCKTETRISKGNSFIQDLAQAQALFKAGNETLPDINFGDNSAFNGTVPELAKKIDEQKGNDQYNKDLLARIEKLEKEQNAQKEINNSTKVAEDPAKKEVNNEVK